jgi:membrane protease YdiL (CAAX protease family)
MSINLGENSIILFLLMSLEILLILIPNLITSYFDKKSFKEELLDLGFKKSDFKKKKFFILSSQGILLGVFLFLIADWIFFFYVNILIKFIMGPAFIESGINNAINVDPVNPQIAEIIILVFLQILIIGPCEEGFFRGFLQKKIEQKTNFILGWVISSLCFSIYHVPPFIVPLSTIITFFGYFFIFGLIFGGFYKINKESLLPCIIAHSSFNILLLIF